MLISTFMQYVNLKYTTL